VSERRYLTVVETRPFMAEVERCLATDEREQFIEYIACNPTAGAMIRDTGRARDLLLPQRAHPAVLTHGLHQSAEDRPLSNGKSHDAALGGRDRSVLFS